MQNLYIFGTVDGSNTFFAVQVSPYSQSPAPTFVKLFRNTLLQNPMIDYSRSGINVAFNPCSIPQVGDTLAASGEV